MHFVSPWLAASGAGVAGAGPDTPIDTTRLPVKNVDFSFEGPFGTYDRGALQRGFQVYKEVCSACHSLDHIAFHNLDEAGGPGFTEAQAKAIAAGYKIPADPNDKGEIFDDKGNAPDPRRAPWPTISRRPSPMRKRPAPTMAAPCRPIFP